MPAFVCTGQLTHPRHRQKRFCFALKLLVDALQNRKLLSWMDVEGYYTVNRCAKNKFS